MKKIFILSFYFIATFSLRSQTIYIDWQRSLGGSGGDQANSIIQTNDSGYVVAGSSTSNNGNVTGNHGNQDCWIVKLDRNGTVQWEKSLGGSGQDGASSIIQTTDGGYVVAGYSDSTSGDVTGNHGNTDYWIVKLTSTGTIQWQKSLGGSELDLAGSIIQTTDGGYAVTGASFSMDGDVTGTHGNSDSWVVKLNSVGTIQWQKSLGGSGIDGSGSITQTSDSGYVVAGFSFSTNGDVSGNHGSADYWIVKLNSNGAILWQKSLGGSGEDEANSIIPTNDGGYAVAGYSASNNGDVSGNHGSRDYWVVKLNTTGTIQWQKSLGGIGSESASSIIQTSDSGYTITGLSYSTNGDVTGNHGNADYWIVKLTSTGTIQWQKSLGGIGSDGARSIIQTSDSAYSIAGYSASNNGDVTGNHGNADYWIVKVRLCYLTPPIITLSDSTTFCSGDSITFTSNSLNNNHWSQGDTTQSIVVYASGIYADTIRNLSGCGISNATTVTVNVNPTAFISPITDTICRGSNTTLTASGGGTYNWSNALGSNTQVTVSPNATIAYTVTVTNSNNCSTSASRTVAVNSNPPASITPAIVAICNGTNATLTASGGNAYAWNNSLGSNAQVTVSPTASITYSVTVTDANLCSATTSVLVNVKYPASQSLCMVTVDSNSSHNVLVWEKVNQEAIDSFYIYREISTNNYAKIGAVHRDSLSEYQDYGANPNITGYRYKISIKDTCGSEGFQSEYHNSIHLQYLGSGNLQWNIYAIENETTPVSTFDIYRDSTGNGNWQLMISVPGNQSTTTDINYNQNPNIKYRVIANWSFTCTSTRSTISSVFSNVITLSQTGIREANIYNINIYPNPATDQLFIETSNLPVEQISIYNSIGSLVTQAQLFNNHIDISTLPTGVYVAEIIIKEACFRKRWMKM